MLVRASVSRRLCQSSLISRVSLEQRIEPFELLQKIPVRDSNVKVA